jgi:MtfA peptidase
MPDTTFILDGQEVTLFNYTVVNDSVLNELRKINQHIPQEPIKLISNNDSIDYLTIGFFTILFFFVIIKIRSIILSKDKYFVLRSNLDSDEQYIDAVQSARYESVEAKDYFLYNESNLNLSHQEIKDILDKYFVYYNNLDVPLQNKFFERVFKFMYSKNFLIYSNEPYKEMPVLISAVAVQISFGLNEYELPYYKYIQVKKEAYFARKSLHVLAGNVEGNSITLAWNHLLNGIYYLKDGDNVALHEMAHALYYQKIIIEKDSSDFSNYFNQLMQDGQYIVEQKVCPHNLYTTYAFKNLQEFWAVSVELFFEKTPLLQTAYPHIFEHLQKLLKQNPLNYRQPLC